MHWVLKLFGHHDFQYNDTLYNDIMYTDTKDNAHILPQDSVQLNQYNDN